MGAKVKLNSAEFRRILRSPGAFAALLPMGERVLAKAKADAEVATGEYRESLHLEQVITDRAVVRVVSKTDHSIAVEARTGNLARALDAAG